MTLFSNRLKGFSNDVLGHRQRSLAAIVDGPYGRHTDLDHFDKVLIIARGIGPVAHLLAARHLVQAHFDPAARVRRLSLVWILGNKGKFTDCASSDYHALTDQRSGALGERVPGELLLLDMERHILTILVHIPRSEEDMDGTSKGVVESPQRLFRTQRSFNVIWTMESEWNAEASNVAVSRT